MTPFVANLNQILALGTVALQIAALILIILYLKKDTSVFSEGIRSVALKGVFLFSVAGTFLTLLYSEVFGFIPCGLCWFERIFLYPMVILTGIALYTKDSRIWSYILGLAIPGAIVSLYHHYIQMGGSELVGCPAAGADCAKRVIFELGYITFPLMAFSLFMFMIGLALLARHQKAQS